MGGGFLFSLADWKHSSGRGTAVGWLVCLWRLLVLLFWVFSSPPPPPPLAAGFAFCSRVARVGGGRAGLSGGAADTGGQVWAAGRHGTGTGTGTALLPRACSLNVPSWREAAIGAGGRHTGPSPPLPAPAAGPEGRENVQVRGLFRCARERWKKRCSRDMSALRGAAVSRGGMLGHGVCAGSSPPPALPAVPRTCPAPRGFGLRCCWGTRRGQFGARWVPGRAGFAGQWGDQLPGVTQS